MPPKHLNAPYAMGGYLDVYGTLTLEPGATLLFDEKDNLTIYGGLVAVGTAEAPIVFTSLKQSWDTLSFEETSASRLAYTEVSYAVGGLYLTDDAHVMLGNSSLSHSGSYAVNCYDLEFDKYVLELAAGNTFSDNADGAVDPDCGVKP